MKLTIVPPKGLADAYSTIRTTMAETLGCVAAQVESRCDLMVGALSGPAKEAALAEFSPLRMAVNFATARADALMEFGPADDHHEMFDALENASMSLGHLIILLRAIHAVQ